MPWIDNFAFYDASSQNGLVSKAEYYRNKIDNHIADFIIRIRESKKDGPEMRGQIIIF
ncbi:hypothetical protein C1646_768986 [Rhizophagus diaphanus]|nr:hypothetical protein C1646_768986 [Rhizophagus diaphanus] [Rhizophagus sp. MUCL 43196]